ncbi:hypothetical protein B566_EDAN002731 [Ephemera danica]|nr:hypothetical protein B566_EDAN002731 [Ephemera danica]
MVQWSFFALDKVADLAYPNVPQDRLKIEHGINSTLTVKDANDEIAAIPLITPGGTGINVKSGKPLTLQCIILGGVPDPVFKNWEIRHEDKSLPRNVIKSHNNDDDYNLPEDHQTITESTQRWLLHNNDKGQAIGKLMIKEVQIDDAGNYTCTAKSDIGEDKKIFYVKVADGGTGGLGGGTIAGICIAIVLQLSL